MAPLDQLMEEIEILKSQGYSTIDAVYAIAGQYQLSAEQANRLLRQRQALERDLHRNGA
jgi:hypothetical protein